VVFFSVLEVSVFLLLDLDLDLVVFVLVGFLVVSSAANIDVAPSIRDKPRNIAAIFFM
jgi:hypothetical protein